MGTNTVEGRPMPKAQKVKSHKGTSAKSPVSRSPRIAVTLPPDIYAAVKDLADLTDQPMSRLVAELATESAPYLARIAAQIRAIKETEAQKAAYVNGILAQAETEARTAANTAFNLLDRLAAPPAPGGPPRHAQRVGVAPQPAKPPRRPPPANRGDEK